MFLGTTLPESFDQFLDFHILARYHRLIPQQAIESYCCVSKTQVLV
jgi:hypothetical protein